MSARHRSGVRLLAILGIAAAVAGCAPVGTPDPSGFDPSASDPSGLGIPVPVSAIEMTVVSITDGDTLRLRADRPGDLVTTTRPIAVRLIGIDTPEVYPVAECFGAEAEDELARLAPVGSVVRVGADLDTWDDYDRRLFYLWGDDGTFINGALVAGGFAEAIRVAPNDAHFEALLDAEYAARAARAGMWGSC